MASLHTAARVVVLLAIAAGLAAAQWFLVEPESTPLWQALFNSGHAPLYGVASWIVLVLLDTVRPTWRRVRRYFEALAIAVSAGGVMEVLQYFGARDPQWADFGRNVLGCAAFLSFAASFDRSLLPESVRGGTGARFGLRLASVVLLAIAFIPVILAGGAIVARDRAFPNLCDFDTIWERQLVFVNESAQVEYRAAPETLRDDDGDSAAFVTFLPGRYSTLTLFDPHPDWTGYGALKFALFSNLAESETLTLWIEDDLHTKGSPGWFSRKIAIEPGVNRFEIALSDVRTTAKKRELDMTRIHKIVIYGSEVQKPFSLFIDDVRLE